jgi:hypothetical protein
MIHLIYVIILEIFKTRNITDTGKCIGRMEISTEETGRKTKDTA